jgi:glucose-1-phosphate adenylyltransferase
VNSYAVVEQSILYERVDVGRYARVRRAILDKDVKVPPHTTVGYDLEHDRQRGFALTEQGVVIVAKGTHPDVFTAPKR